ncbi:MAG: hypothetical protein WCI03_14060 [bacterium]
MTIDEIKIHTAPCNIFFHNNTMIYCRWMKVGEHPVMGVTIQIIDADNNKKNISADTIVRITKALPLPG